MNYRVDWAPTAEQQLATDPLRFGTPIDSSIHRVGSFDVLGIEFEVIEDDKRVIVHGAFAVGWHLPFRRTSGSRSLPL
jgi:hypothetical protein